MSKKAAKKHPKNPKLEEIRKWDKLISDLQALSEFDEWFERNSKVALELLDEVESDGNVETRFHNFLNFVADKSLQEVRSMVEKIKLTQAKLDGSHWGMEDQDIDAMTIPQLKKYAASMKWEGPYPKKKPDLLAAIRERLAGGDDDE